MLLAPKRRRAANALVERGAARDSEPVATALKESTLDRVLQVVLSGHSCRAAAALVPGGAVPYSLGFHDADLAGW